MAKNKKLWLGVGMIALIVVFFVLGSYNCNKETDDVIKIGAILPLSGTASFYGESGRRGIEIARDYFMKEHSNVVVKIVIKDDKGITRDGLVAVNQVKASGCTYVVGPMMSGIALAAVSSNREDKKVVFILPTATTPSLRGFSENVFRTCVSDDAEGGAVADYIHKTYNLSKTVSVLYLNNEYGYGVANAFVQRLANYKMQPLFIESYESQDSNIRMKLLKVLSKVPDFVFLVGQKEQKVVVKQLRELGFGGGILGTTMFEDPELLSLPEMRGAVYSSRVLMNGVISGVSHPFYAIYKGKYGEEANYYAASCFDSAICAMTCAFELSRNPNCEPFEVPLAIKFKDGATGCLLFDDKHDVMQSFCMKVVCEDGKSELVR